MMRVIEVTDASGAVIETQWMMRAEAVHRQLRTEMPADYAGTLAPVFAGGGRMCVAAEDAQVLGVAVWRILTNTVYGRFVYVDDLVTDEARRSGGVGKLLLSWCEERARSLGCAHFCLDSPVQYYRAHKFYFRENLIVRSYRFWKALI